jgi:predicted Zn-dependent peptidase
MLDKTVNPASYDYRSQGFSFCAPQDLSFERYKIFEYTDDSLDISYCEFVFFHGRSADENQAISSILSRMIVYFKLEDNQSLFDLFEFYGGKVSFDSSMTFCTIKVYALRRYFDRLLKAVLFALRKPSFEEDHLNFCKKSACDDLLTAHLDKNYWSTKSYNTFFWKGTSIASNATVSTIKAVNRSMVIEKWKNLSSNLGYIVVMNTVLDQSLLNDFETKEKRDHISIDFSEKCVNVYPKISEQQSLLHLTFPFVNKLSVRYPEYYFYNQVLGGSFQSILSQEIRERQGLTYGIGSSLLSVNENTYLQIKSTTPYLKGQEVSGKILNLMKNFDSFINDDYLEETKRLASVGFLKTMENVFSQISLFHSLQMDGISKSFYSNLLEGIKRTSADDLSEINHAVLNSDSLALVVV